MKDFNFEKAEHYLHLAREASYIDVQLEANILVRISKMIMEYNTGDKK